MGWEMNGRADLIEFQIRLPLVLSDIDAMSDSSYFNAA